MCRRIESCPPRPPSPPTPPTPTPSSAAACSPPTGQKTFPLSPSLLLTQVLPFDFGKSFGKHFIDIFPGTVNTKMLLEGWGPCGIPLSQADDTFWQATSQEVSLRCDNLFSSSKLSFFTNHGIFGSLIFPALATTTCLGKGEVEETTVRKKSKILWHFLSSALSLKSESDDNPLNFSEEKRSVWPRCNCA